jgi:NADPH:quinone reductase-like Zn-dependent oxidoreductase
LLDYTVEAIGEDVTGFAIGDKVSTIPAFSMNRYSVYGEQAIVPATATVKHPDNLSWEQATAIWMQYLTAYGALIDAAQLVPGDAVIITAASSSVGLAAMRQYRSLTLRARSRSQPHARARSAKRAWPWCAVRDHDR